MSSSIKEVSSVESRRWEPMKLAFVGHVADVMHGATGTLGDGGGGSKRT
ncbi:MAG: hypothetical protein H0W90_09745 [Actinobacteria bacterium]|nr:hypothetical protein [Actinomycetota bacterium]